MKTQVVWYCSLKRRVDYFIQKSTLNTEENSSKLNRALSLLAVKGHDRANSNVQLPGAISTAKENQLNFSRRHLPYLSLALERLGNFLIKKLILGAKCQGKMKKEPGFAEAGNSKNLCCPCKPPVTSVTTEGSLQCPAVIQGCKTSWKRQNIRLLL